jgi:hypothetical protein
MLNDMDNSNNSFIPYTGIDPRIQFSVFRIGLFSIVLYMSNEVIYPAEIKKNYNGMCPLINK